MLSKINPRIISGEFKGRRLKVPDEARPMTDRVKKTLFDILGDIEGVNVLDLFAGSGNLGIEALSRGASSATFIDRSEDSIEAINENIKNLSIQDRTKVWKRDYKKLDNLNLDKFQLILIDPPFSLARRIDFTELSELLNKNGIIVIKIPSNIIDFNLPSSFQIIDKREIGINTLYFIRLK